MIVKRGVQPPLSLDIAGINLKLNELSPHALSADGITRLLGCLRPWSLPNDKAFDLLQPIVGTSNLSAKDKVITCASTLVSRVMVPLVKRGESARDQLQLFANIANMFLQGANDHTEHMEDTILNAVLEFGSVIAAIASLLSSPLQDNLGAMDDLLNLHKHFHSTAGTAFGVVAQAMQRVEWYEERLDGIIRTETHIVELAPLLSSGLAELAEIMEGEAEAEIAEQMRVCAQVYQCLTKAQTALDAERAAHYNSLIEVHVETLMTKLNAAISEKTLCVSDVTALNNDIREIAFAFPLSSNVNSADVALASHNKDYRHAGLAQSLQAPLSDLLAMSLDAGEASLSGPCASLIKATQGAAGVNMSVDIINRMKRVLTFAMSVSAKHPASLGKTMLNAVTELIPVEPSFCNKDVVQ